MWGWPELDWPDKNRRYSSLYRIIGHFVAQRSAKSIAGNEEKPLIAGRTAGWKREDSGQKSAQNVLTPKGIMHERG